MSARNCKSQFERMYLLHMMSGTPCILPVACLSARPARLGKPPPFPPSSVFFAFLSSIKSTLLRDQQFCALLEPRLGAVNPDTQPKRPDISAHGRSLLASHHFYHEPRPQHRQTRRQQDRSRCLSLKITICKPPRIPLNPFHAARLVRYPCCRPASHAT